MTEALQQEIRTLKNIFESERDPEGRVFAPLADAYRRAGEIQQAVRLLSEGLARHPNFVPGHVVAAQLYVEQGLAEEAAIAARRALSLDAENVNAMRALLRVMEGNGDDGADELRAQLIDLEPGFAGEAAVATEAPPSQEKTVALETPPVDLAAAGPAVEDVESTWEQESPANDGPAGIQIEPAPEGVGSAGEPLIDLSSLAIPEVDAPIGMSGLGPISDDELPGEEPVVDLADLPPIGSEAAEAAAAPALDPAVDELPDLDDPGPSAFDEPVMDLDDLGPEDEVAVSDLADLAAVEADPGETVVDLGALAPDTPEDVIDLAELAPPEEPVDEEVVDLGDLAPAADSDEPTMELSDLAPDEGVVALADLAPADDAAIDLADLAPSAVEDDAIELSELAPDEDGPAVDLADLAPSADETVMELDALAPDEPEEVVALADLAPAEDDAVDLADLAPSAVEDEAVDLADLAPSTVDDDAMDLADLAPDDDEPAVDLADLAPSADETVMELDALAPDEPEEEEVVALADLAPAEVEDDAIDLADLAPTEDDDDAIDLSDLAPSDADDEPVMELGALAPDEPEDDGAFEDLAPADDAAVDLADLAPADDVDEESPIMDFASLSRDDADSEDEPVMELGEPAPSTEEDEPAEEGEDEAMSVREALSDPPEDAAAEVTMVDLVDQTDEAESDRASAPAAEDDDDHAPGEPVYTRTLAELYVKQGAVDQALVVYRHLAELSPDDEEIARRIEELESGAVLEEGGGVLTGEAEEEVEMLARELAEHGDEARHEVESPYTLDATHPESDVDAESADQGPTISDYFQGLLGWRSEEHS